MLKLSTLISVAAIAGTLAVASQPTIPVSPVTQDGRTLVVPQGHKAKGTLYYAITDKDRQIYFESNAPLENIKGQSNDVIGYAAVSPEIRSSVDADAISREQKRLEQEGRSKAEALRTSAVDFVEGEFHLPIASMKTGIELRDEHLAGKGWLDAASHPDVIVQIIGVSSLSTTRETERFMSMSVTLVADVTIHGITQTIEIPDTTVSVMPESEATRKVARGDLMAIRSKFTVTLADYEVSNPVIGEKVAKDVQIDVSLFLSTLPPERQ